MLVVDTNILIYAHREESEAHPAALAKLKALAEGRTPWGLTVFSLAEFVRVVTHPRVFRPATQLSTALDVLEALLGSPSLKLLRPGDGYWHSYCELSRSAHARGNLAFDAQIAASCREHGIDTILSEDRDFERFPIQRQSL